MCCGNSNLGSSNTKAARKKGVCAVHQLVMNDEKERDVEYCLLCDKWICDECMPKIGRRGLAFILAKSEEVLSWFK